MSAAGTGGGRTPVFVLIHSPLVGPLTWSAVADRLRRRGHRVVVPHLDNPDRPAVSFQHHHAEQVRRAVEAETATEPVVLVSHSGAGAVLPLAGDTLVNEVVAYVLVDADLPHDGTRRLDAAPPEFRARLDALTDRGRLPPWEDWWDDDVLEHLLPDPDVREAFAGELESIPRTLFEERIRVPPAWPDAPCSYLRLSRVYGDAATEAQRRGWNVVTLDAGHLHMLVAPGEVADALEDLTLGRPTVERARAGGGAVAPATSDDPVAQQRRRIARWVDTGRRVGFSALTLAIAVFAVALYWDLPATLVAVIIGCLVVATVTLLPAIIAGYGLAAAEREEREHREQRAQQRDGQDRRHPPR